VGNGIGKEQGGFLANQVFSIQIESYSVQRMGKVII